MDSRADTGGKQFHLQVPVAGAVIEAEKLWAAEPGHGAPDHGHEVFILVVKKDICRDNEAAGIVDKGDEVDALFPLASVQVRSETSVTIPDFVDMRAFITAHIPAAGHFRFLLEAADKALDGGSGYLSDSNAAVRQELPVYLGGCHAGVFRFHEADL